MEVGIKCNMLQLPVHLFFKLTHNFQVEVGQPRRTRNPGTVLFNTVKQGHFLIIWVHLIIPIAQFTGLTIPRKKIHKKRSNYGVEQYMKKSHHVICETPHFLNNGGNNPIKRETHQHF